MKQIDVKIPAIPQDSYPIYIENGSLGDVVKQVEINFPNKARFVITDSKLVEANHLKTLDPDGEIPFFVIDPPGEASKNIEMVVQMVEQMEKEFFGRDTVIIALGGGTVGDMAGFAGAIFKRGVPVVQVPTTTVSQADSAVGGKTGVDSSVSKNAFGAFHFPSAVYIDVATLDTLDEREFKSGLVESVKHALICDETYFDIFEAKIDAIIDRDKELLELIAERNCKIKAAVVEDDPRETNKRRILNYGHTIGHAIESASGFELIHGESVAIGILAVGMIELEMGLANLTQLQRIKAIFEKLSLPTKIPSEITEDMIIELLRRDKKAVSGWPKFVLLDGIGKVKTDNSQWAVNVDEKIIRKILPQLY
jgi:3-dehydroquinate synthase